LDEGGNKGDETPEIDDYTLCSDGETLAFSCPVPENCGLLPPGE
jgi:hypothetical protein